MNGLDELLHAPSRQVAGLSETGHRPWPLPRGTWVLGQSWLSLLFAHWRIEARALRPLVPRALHVEERDGSAWLGITPFIVSGLRAVATPPLPGLSSFPELNVRTYVTDGEKPGIWFFSLDAASRVAVEAARRLFHLPYFHADMTVRRAGDELRFRSVRRGLGERLEVSYRPAGVAQAAAPGTLEAFLAERYCLYAQDGRGRLRRTEIHHPPWPLRPAEAELRENTLSCAFPVEGEPLLQFAERQDVLVWPPRAIG